jgi:isoquinoline 1-oxidoreductase beta subunit
VQVVLSQSASQNHDRPSGGALARMTALPGAGGITAAWKMRVALADGFGAALASLNGEGAPKKLGRPALDGSAPPYGIPNTSVDAIPVKVPFEAGYMRGSPQREFAFFIESFVDELAHAAGIEPLAIRMSMLGSNGRLARCLQGAARLAQWDGGGAGSTMGIAGVSAFGSHIGLVATASIAEGKVKVHRLVAAVDCGRVINSGIAAQQIESGLIWALAQATVAEPEWVAGMPRARSIGSLGLPRLSDTPEIVVELIPSSDAPGGLSGLGTTVLAPAVANAIFAGSGKRMRSLPFDPMAA